MKALFTLLLAATTFLAHAQTASVVDVKTTTAPAPDSYTTLMAATIAEALQTDDVAAAQRVLDKLARAAAARPTDWLPRYYLAYEAVHQAFLGGDATAKDAALDRAQTDLDRARQLPAADESELLCLQAYLHQARIMVAPMARGMKYTAKVQEALNAAQQANPANPRSYYLRGNDLYFRPAMFGGGAEAARPYYLKAKEAFATFQPTSTLAPSWGERQTLGLLKKIDEAK
jgi:hypothetical protein